MFKMVFSKKKFKASGEKVEELTKEVLDGIDNAVIYFANEKDTTGSIFLGSHKLMIRKSWCEPY